MFNRIRESVKKNERMIINAMCLSPNMLMLNPEMIKAIAEEERAIEQEMHR